MRRLMLTIAMMVIAAVPAQAVLPTPYVLKCPRYAASGKVRTPFAALVGLQAGDTLSANYYYKPRLLFNTTTGRMNFWIDGTSDSLQTRYTWGTDGAAWRGCPRVAVPNNPFDTTKFWVFVRSTDTFPAIDSLKLRVRRCSTTAGSVDSRMIPVDTVDIMDMTSSGTGGWLAGHIRQPGGTVLTDHIVLAFRKGIIVGSGITENNHIAEEFDSTDAGFFLIAVRADSIDSLSAYPRNGFVPVAHETQTSPKWYVYPGDTTWVDLPPAGPSISGVSRFPQYPFSSEQVLVKANIVGQNAVIGDSILYCTDTLASWNGAPHDSIRNDSCYFFHIPPQDTGKTVFYRLVAYDSATGARTITAVSYYRLPLDHDIATIQRTSTASGTSPDSGKYVHTTGIVTNVLTQQKVFFGTAEGGWWQGLHLYRYSDTSLTLRVGDSIEVAGVVSEFRRLSQISNPYRLQIVGTGRSFATARLTIAETRCESAEAVRLQVDTVRFIDGVGSNFMGNRSYRITNRDGTETTWVYITAGCELARIATPVPAGYVGITGNGSQYDTAWQITPGLQSDISPILPDVAALEIIAPKGTSAPDISVTPRAVFRNLSTVAMAVDVPVRFRIGGLYNVSKTIASLPPGAVDTVSFDDWTTVTGSYSVLAYSELNGDPDRSNDTVRASLVVTGPQVSQWNRRADVPAGPKNKNVKDGGALAFNPEGDTGFVYAFKGNNRLEFYRYNITTNTWQTRESIPAVGRSGKKKAVKKGASLSQCSGTIYGTKGNGTLEFWQYVPGIGWSQLTDVPAGSKSIKEGSGQAAIAVNDSHFVYLLRGSGTQDFYRYNVATGNWETMAPAPLGSSGKPFKDGSCIASDGAQTIVALKGSYNELFKYDVATNTWTTLNPLPFTGQSGKKAKVKSGAGIVLFGGAAYALKGNNTLEFWQYKLDTGPWVQLANLPEGTGKNVKGGGALTYGSGLTDQLPAIYALKGNNTLEFYDYPVTDFLTVLRTAANAVTGTSDHSARFLLSTTPNPFSAAATITYSLPAAGPVSLKLYDVTGKLVTTLAKGYRPAGNYKLQVSGTSLTSGIYLLKLETPTATATAKLTIE